MAVATSNTVTPKTRNDIALRREREQLQMTLDRSQAWHQDAMREEWDMYRDTVARMDTRWLQDNAALLKRLRELDKALGG